MTDTPAAPPPLAPDAPITRANFAQALLGAIADLPREAPILGAEPRLVVFDEGAGGPVTFLPAAPEKDADHA